MSFGIGPWNSKILGEAASAVNWLGCASWKHECIGAMVGEQELSRLCPRYRLPTSSRTQLCAHKGCRGLGNHVMLACNKGGCESCDSVHILGDLILLSVRDV
jgi:hypothetical protein